MSRKEWVGRALLLDRLTKAIEIFSRREYFHIVFEGYRNARSNVIAMVTGTRPKPEDAQLIKELLNLIRDKTSQGVRVRLLLPKSPDKLYMAYRYHKANADVTLHENILVYDLRYMVVDGRYVIIGLPIEAGEYKPTRKGVVIRSEVLAMILTRYFERFYGSRNAVKYEDYIAELIKNMLRETPELSNETIATHLNIPVDEVSRIREKHRI